jgi:hypothetical protein
MREDYGDRSPGAGLDTPRLSRGWIALYGSVRNLAP